MTTPPACRTTFIDLPLLRLHVLEVGQGPLLVLVPATLSELEDWKSLAQFMGQWFHVIYFELPGHGESQPFPVRFNSHLVADLVEQLVDAFGVERFNLMGFSFGGVLAMRVFERLRGRIDRLVLLAPCLTCRALFLPPRRVRSIRRLARLIDHPSMRAGLLWVFHNRRLVRGAGWVLRRMGNIRERSPLEHKLAHVRASTLEVLAAQIEEIMTVELALPETRHGTPTFFAMSLYDTLLDFETTLAVAEKHFSDLTVLRLSYPFHQPPEPFTFNELRSDFQSTVEAFLLASPPSRA